MLDQLAPCPFCGGSAGLKTAPTMFGNEWADLGYFIECVECGSRTKTVDHWGNRGGRCFETLAAHWNNRVAPLPDPSIDLEIRNTQPTELSPPISSALRTAAAALGG